MRRLLLALSFFTLTSLGTAQELAVGFSDTRATLEAREREYASLASDVDQMERELGIIKRVVRLVTPAVVHIDATPVQDRRSRSSYVESGSGVIVQMGEQHCILTNRHVIKDSSPTHIDIQLADGRTIHPSAIWSDQYTDVAVMAVKAEEIVTARIGNSDALQIGEQVLAVGSPFGLSQSVTRGIISGKGRHNLDLGDGEVTLQNFLQTDAAINPGNSGGPLINLKGEVVGINTAIASSSGGNEGIGFSIPVNIVVRIAKQLTETGQFARGYLGVKFDNLFDERRAVAIGLPQLAGTRVGAIVPNSPASRASLQPNDVILQYNGTRVEDGDHLSSLVQLTEIGTRVELVLFRNGHLIRSQVEIGDAREQDKKR